MIYYISLLFKKYKLNIILYLYYIIRKNTDVEIGGINIITKRYEINQKRWRFKIKKFYLG